VPCNTCVRNNDTCVSTSSEKVCVPCHIRKCACVPSDGSIAPWIARAIARKSGSKAPAPRTRGAKRQRSPNAVTDSEAGPSQAGQSENPSRSPSAKHSSRAGTRKASRMEPGQEQPRLAAPVIRDRAVVVIPARRDLMLRVQMAQGMYYSLIHISCCNDK